MMRIRSSADTRAALLVALLVLATGPSRAADFTLDVLQNGASIGSFDETDFSCALQGGGPLESCEAFGLLTSGDLSLDGIILDINPDPFIGGDFTVTNTGATANYTFIFTASVAPIAVTTLTSGSADGGGSDGFGDGVFMSTVDNGNLNLSDDAFYAALIDGVVYDTLIPHPTTAAPPNGLSTQFPHDEFGNQLNPDQPGPVITSTMGITWDFSMTGSGDTASFTGVFKAKPVPEPGTGFLLALGLAALARVGRRR